MQSFLEKLLECSRKNHTMLCVGLDIDLSLTPPGFVASADSILAFNQAIIEATSDLVCAYKPNLAFYEALGLEGIEALRKTMASIPRHIPVIGDAKRSDVGHTAKAYARAMFDFFGFDAVTVNPYLGRDAVQPFIEYHDKGVICLCKTSNPGSADFQDLVVTDNNAAAGEPLYIAVARRVNDWNTHGNCGLVVGATFPEQLRRVRELASAMPILIPGIGVQAGDLELSVRYGTDDRGELAIINSSRQVLYASRDADFARASRSAAKSLRDAINQVRRAGSEGGDYGN
ncbi:MAG: orotidine-5'-phosphate decarboxylase [Chloroflexi bacterium]|nr:orotidine-5'-phosphate decarboxylase [Chloroflexota bacterium]